MVSTSSHWCRNAIDTATNAPIPLGSVHMPLHCIIYLKRDFASLYSMRQNMPSISIWSSARLELMCALLIKVCCSLIIVSMLQGIKVAKRTPCRPRSHRRHPGRLSLAGLCPSGPQHQPRWYLRHLQHHPQHVSGRSQPLQAQAVFHVASRLLRPQSPAVATHEAACHVALLHHPGSQGAQ